MAHSGVVTVSDSLLDQSCVVRWGWSRIALDRENKNRTTIDMYLMYGSLRYVRYRIVWYRTIPYHTTGRWESSTGSVLCGGWTSQVSRRGVIGRGFTHTHTSKEPHSFNARVIYIYINYTKGTNQFLSLKSNKIIFEGWIHSIPWGFLYVAGPCKMQIYSLANCFGYVRIVCVDILGLNSWILQRRRHNHSSHSYTDRFSMVSFHVVIVVKIIEIVVKIIDPSSFSMQYANCCSIILFF